MYVTIHLKQPTREQRGPRHMLSYLVLLRVGFTLPLLLPAARCALTAPFHPYLKEGGIFSVALAVDLRPPGVTWHPALRSPDFPLYIKMIHSNCPADFCGNYSTGCLFFVLYQQWHYSKYFIHVSKFTAYLFF